MSVTPVLPDAKIAKAQVIALNVIRIILGCIIKSNVCIVSALSGSISVLPSESALAVHLRVPHAMEMIALVANMDISSMEMCAMLVVKIAINALTKTLVKHATLDMLLLIMHAYQHLVIMDNTSIHKRTNALVVKCPAFPAFH